MNTPFPPGPLTARRAFTIVELLVTMAIIAMLAALAAPEYSRLVDRARSTACAGNLRSIGIALLNYVNDNDGRFPHINNPPPLEVYDEDDDLPDDQEPQTLLEALADYGLTAESFRCPADAADAARSNFQKYGTSYEWIPRIDGEQSVAPRVLSRRRGLVTRKLSRIIVMRDFAGVHFGRANRLYGDGRVIAVQQ
jgi:prepilin-type N-terminal cleavage/methylation domain-containing protein